MCYCDHLAIKITYARYQSCLNSAVDIILKQNSTALQYLVSQSLFLSNLKGVFIWVGLRAGFHYRYHFMLYPCYSQGIKYRRRSIPMNTGSIPLIGRSCSNLIPQCLLSVHDVFKLTTGTYSRCFVSSLLTSLKQHWFWILFKSLVFRLCHFAQYLLEDTSGCH